MSTSKKIAIEAERGVAPKSLGKCAMYVRLALERAGVFISYPYPSSAYMYALLLPKIGFKKVPERLIQDGTIAVWSGSDSHPHGHICVKNGNFWYSDFKQKNVMCWITGPGNSKVEYFNFVE